MTDQQRIAKLEAEAARMREELDELKTVLRQMARSMGAPDNIQTALGVPPRRALRDLR
jgi:hypothetical protein